MTAGAELTWAIKELGEVALFYWKTVRYKPGGFALLVEQDASLEVIANTPLKALQTAAANYGRAWDAVVALLEVKS